MIKMKGKNQELVCLFIEKDISLQQMRENIIEKQSMPRVLFGRIASCDVPRLHSSRTMNFH